MTHVWGSAGRVLLVLGGLAWTDVSQQYPCLLLSVAFGGSCVLIPLDPIPPPPPPPKLLWLRHPSAASSPHTTAAACQGGQPWLAEAAGNLRSKIRASGLQIKELGFFLGPLPALLSKGPHHLPAPGQAPAWAGWYCYSERHGTCCCSRGASLGHETWAVRDDVPQPGTEGTPGQTAEPCTPCRGCSLQGLQRNIHTGIRQRGARDTIR